MTNGSFTIRTAQDGDRDDVFTLLNGDGTGHPPEDDHRHPAHIADTIIATSFDPESKSRCWLAIADDKPVGIITTRDLGGGVSVLDDYQGRGIGKALVSAREEFFRDSLDQTESRVPLRADNAKSIALHTSLGYQFDQASKDLLKTNPPGHTVVQMVKTLG
jgi:GNAT superfamily N-acetyltransferase